MSWFGSKKKNCCNIEIKEVEEKKEESQTEECCVTSENEGCCKAEKN